MYDFIELSKDPHLYFSMKNEAFFKTRGCHGCTEGHIVNNFHLRVLHCDAKGFFSASQHQVPDRGDLQKRCLIKKSCLRLKDIELRQLWSCFISGGLLWPQLMMPRVPTCRRVRFSGHVGAFNEFYLFCFTHVHLLLTPAHGVMKREG